MSAEYKQKQSIQEEAKIRPSDMSEKLPAFPGKALAFLGVVVAALAVTGVYTLIAHSSQGRALARETTQNAVPWVGVTHPQLEKPEDEVALPGTLQAYEESPIYARTGGYLVRWTRDLGSRVAKGELLAQIDAPEVDQELNQARAARQQVLAQMELAKISAGRWESLRKSDSVSAQEADQQSSSLLQAKANLAAADANVSRLEQVEGFKKVYAPFSGVLTRRNVDPGALIVAGGGGRELFDIAKVDTLRVFTSVPQSYAPYIKVGAKATVTLQEYSGEKFVGVIAHTSQSIDPATRTLLTEVDVDNKAGHLLPGSFGQVHFAVNANVQKLTVPMNVMLFRAEGPQVAVVDADHRVRLRKLNIGRDYGATIEVLDGLTVNDQIVVNPSDSLQEGAQVNVSPAAEEDQPEGAPQAGQGKKGSGHEAGK